MTVKTHQELADAAKRMIEAASEAHITMICSFDGPDSTCIAACGPMPALAYLAMKTIEEASESTGTHVCTH